MPNKSADYKKAYVNFIFNRPTMEGIDKRINSMEVKEIEVKPTFTITKINDYIHYGKYRGNKLYKEARQRNDEYLGLDIIKFWYMWLTELSEQKGVSIWEVCEEAGLPRLLKHLADKKYRTLASFRYIHRFALMLGEPFIPTYTEQELIDFKIPKFLYESVVKRKTKASLKPRLYGNKPLTEAGLRWFRYKQNKKNELLRWRP